MPVRRSFAVGLWVCVTALATAIVWAGTSTVAADLTDRPAPVVAHRDVVNALVSDSKSPDSGTAPGLTTPPGAGAAPTVAPDGQAPPIAAPAAPVPGPAGPRSPQPGVVTPSPPAPPVTGSSSPPTTEAPGRPMATYSTAGGVVTVACTGFVIELVSATPNNGWAVDVVTAGPFYVEVHFVGAGRDDPLWAFCLGQPVRAYGGAPRQNQGSP